MILSSIVEQMIWTLNWPPHVTTKPVVDIASNLKSEKHDVTTSNILIRRDKLGDKALEVNAHLTRFYKEKDIAFTYHSMKAKRI